MAQINAGFYGPSKADFFNLAVKLPIGFKFPKRIMETAFINHAKGGLFARYMAAHLLK
ncbi:MAG: hypothetical protein O3C44_11475 [Proteobacteria bacterium]|nr:hypothetical protein [Pseudomonadota bacterium]